MHKRKKNNPVVTTNGELTKILQYIKPSNNAYIYNNDSNAWHLLLCMSTELLLLAISDSNLRLKSKIYHIFWLKDAVFFLFKEKLSTGLVLFLGCVIQCFLQSILIIHEPKMIAQIQQNWISIFWAQNQHFNLRPLLK